MTKYQKQLNSGIKRLRINNGLTQEQFAEAVNLTVEALRNIEYNRYTPTAKTIDSICNTFSVTPIDLLLPDISKEKDELLNRLNIRLSELDAVELLKINDLISILKNEYKNI